MSDIGRWRASDMGRCRMSDRGLGGVDQATPIFDAKGIETVRRDTCAAVAKMMERSLRILFSTKDLSQVLPGAFSGPALLL